MKIVALLTGRGRSSLKDKNILPICGNPLLYYPAMAAKKSKHITAFYISSDDDKILNIASDLGYTKIRRPVILRYSEEFPTLKQARQRETEIKGWRREKKLALILHQ